MIKKFPNLNESDKKIISKMINKLSIKEIISLINQKIKSQKRNL